MDFEHISFSFRRCFALTSLRNFLCLKALKIKCEFSVIISERMLLQDQPLPLVYTDEKKFKQIS